MPPLPTMTLCQTIKSSHVTFAQSAAWSVAATGRPFELSSFEFEDRGESEAASERIFRPATAVCSKARPRREIKSAASGAAFSYSHTLSLSGRICGRTRERKKQKSAEGGMIKGCYFSFISSVRAFVAKKNIWMSTVANLSFVCQL